MNNYYLSPSLAYEKVQVKYLPEQLEIYYEDGRYIMTVPRMNTKPEQDTLIGVLI